jgi:hypothetical protein
MEDQIKYNLVIQIRTNGNRRFSLFSFISNKNLINGYNIKYKHLDICLQPSSVSYQLEKCLQMQKEIEKGQL